MTIKPSAFVIIFPATSSKIIKRPKANYVRLKLLEQGIFNVRMNQLRCKIQDTPIVKFISISVVKNRLTYIPVVIYYTQVTSVNFK